MNAELGSYIVKTGDPEGACEIAEMNGEMIKGSDVECIDHLAMALADFERKEYIGEIFRYEDYGEIAE